VLSEQIVDILLRNNTYPSLYIMKERTRKGVHHKESYHVTWSEEARAQHTFVYPDAKGRSFWMLPIKKLERRIYRGPVYNLTVEGEHSYVATNFAVSNCGKGGDVFQFVMAIEGLEFGDALRQLAQKAGVELPQRDSGFARVQSERKRFQELLELASKFFEKQLESKSGEAIKEYLKGRGVSDESLVSWRVGYAPDTRRTLLDFLLGQGYSEQEIGRAGLLVRTEESVYDRFRSRIMFPVFSLQGEVVGFGGRIFGKEGKDLAKYVNTPGTILYDKSRILYGLDKAKLEIRKQDSCILVEGYMDAIMAHQAGTQNVVATSGTALTSYHLQLLKRYSENLLLAFDMDVAGDTATKRGIELALSQGFTLKIVRLEGGKDPADIASKDPKVWQEAIAQASSIIDYYFETTFAAFDKTTAEGKKKAAALLLLVIFKLPNKIEQTHWVQRLAEELDVKEEVVFQELRKVEQGPLPREKIVSLSPAEKKGRRELIEERILILLFRDPENLKKLKEGDTQLMSFKTQEIVAGLQGAKNLEFSSLEKVFSKTNLESTKRLALLADLEEDEEGIQDEFLLCLKSLMVFSLKERLEGIIKEIRKAEGAKESIKLNLLLQEFHEITKELLVPPYGGS
ncbi:MAG: DNA primase, partial [bacterium]|nr:DNA primase [bacterium]